MARREEELESDRGSDGKFCVMAKMHQFPVDMRPIDKDIYQVNPGDPMWRIHYEDTKYPTKWNQYREFGPVGSARFDPHPPPKRAVGAHDLDHFAVMYAADRFGVAVAEVFQGNRHVNSERGKPMMAHFSPTRQLNLLDLGGRWVTRSGGSQVISSGPRPVSRNWSHEIRMKYPNLDGLRYPSSMFGGGWCYALFKPSMDAIPAQPMLHRPLSHAEMAPYLEAVCTDLGYSRNNALIDLATLMTDPGSIGKLTAKLTV